jgi:penicillin-binding protein 1A
LIAALAVVLGLAAAGAGVLAVITPSVANAEARVRALQRLHGGPDSQAPVPRLFAESIVASEDARFYSDDGIDPVGLARAAWTTVTGGGDGGGSTLSQQLAKLLYTNGQSTVADKVEQVVLALKLNLAYSKPQILEMYADTVYFGQGYYGLDAAACGYFGSRPSALTLSQASMLAGLVQAPSAYDPVRHLALARSRQRYVLGRLVETHIVSSAAAAAAAHAPLGLVQPQPGHCG